MKYNDHDLANVLRRILERKGAITHSHQHRWLDIPGIAVDISSAEAGAIYDEFPRLNTEIPNEVENKQEEWNE